MVPRYSTKDMHRESRPDEFLLSIDASSLGIQPGVFPFGRIYPDAADAGCVLINEAGVEATFALEREFLIGNGEDSELGGWVLRPTTETIHQHPRLANVKLTIFND